MIRTIEEVSQLVTRYCEQYDLKEKYLFCSYKSTSRLKKFEGIRLDQMRMALAYYVTQNSRLTLTSIATAVGYKDHSTICVNNKRVPKYIDVKDPYFYPYWEKLLQVA